MRPPQCHFSGEEQKNGNLSKNVNRHLVLSILFGLQFFLILLNYFNLTYYIENLSKAVQGSLKDFKDSSVHNVYWITKTQENATAPFL